MNKELLPPYDFATRQDAVTEDGDVVPVEVEADPTDSSYFDERADQYPLSVSPDVPPGVSVALSDRMAAVRGLASMYARYACARALETAKGITAHRFELDTRYSDVDRVASAAMGKARQALRHEDDYVELLMKSNDLITAGFDPGDVETQKQRLTIQLRHAIGVDVGASRRNEVLRELHDPNDNDRVK